MDRQKLYSLLNQIHRLEASGNYRQADILDNIIKTATKFNIVGFLDRIKNDVKMLAKYGFVAEDVKLIENLSEAEKAALTTAEAVIKKIKELKAAEALAKTESIRETVKFRDRFKGLRDKAKGVGQGVRNLPGRLSNLLKSVQYRVAKFDKVYDRITKAFESEAGITIDSMGSAELRVKANALGLRRNPVFKVFLQFKEDIELSLKSLAEGFADEEGTLKRLTAEETTKFIEGEGKAWENAGFDPKYVEGLLKGEKTLTLEGFKDAYKPLQMKPGFKVFYALAFGGAAVGGGAMIKNKLDGGSSGETTTETTTETTPETAPETAQESLRTRKFLKQDESAEAFAELKPLITSTPQKLGPTTTLSEIYSYLNAKLGERAANSAILTLRSKNEEEEWGYDYLAGTDIIDSEGFEFIRSY